MKRPPDRRSLYQLRIAPDAIPFTHEVEELDVLEVVFRSGAGMNGMGRACCRVEPARSLRTTTLGDLT